VGRVFSTTNTLRDRLRGRANIGFFKDLDYDAVGLNIRDLAYGRDFVRDAFKEDGIPLLACNLVDKDGKPFVKPYIIKEIDGRKVAVIGVFSAQDSHILLPPGGQFTLGQNYEQALEGLTVQDPIESVREVIKQIKKQAPTIVVLSQLSADDDVKLAEENPEINLILADASLQVLLQKLQPPQPGEDREWLVIGNTYIIQPVPVQDTGGKSLAVINAVLQGSSMEDFAFERKRIPNTLPEDEQMKDKVKQITDDITNNPLVRREFMRRFIGRIPETIAGDGYLGAEACAKCHQPQYDQWKTTDHAKAFQTLVDKQQDAIDNCLKCHTTGFGWESGFDDITKTPNLANAQCETCHGPGKLHAASPHKPNLIRRVTDKVTDKWVCQQCHNVEATPPVADYTDEMFQEQRAKIAH
jgi:hypothetical protein